MRLASQRVLIPLLHVPSSSANLCRASFSTSSRKCEAPSSPPPPAQTANASRWLSETKNRIGKCVLFGLSESQTEKAGGILRILGEEWRELVAGREGFLTGRKDAGLLRHGVVWGEMDSMGHVNNVTYTRYAESARVNWCLNYSLHHSPPQHSLLWRQLCTPSGTGLILKSIRTDYKFPLTYPDRVSVFHKLRAPALPGDENFLLDVVIFSERHQRVAARCEEDIVVFDYKGQRKGKVEGWMGEGFADVWRRQEEVRRKIGVRIEEVERGVVELEKGSWDRVGAVEDLGGRSK